MKSFILIIAIGVLLVGGFVLIIDPGSRWHNSTPLFSRELDKDEVRIYPKNFDERTAKISHLKFIDSPQILFLGSSRVLLVSSDMFDSNVKFFNGGMSTAIVEDFIAIWQTLKELKKTPSQVVIFIDPWLFNVSANKGLIGWNKIGTYVERFYEGKGVIFSYGVFTQSGSSLTLRDKLFWIFNSVRTTKDHLYSNFVDFMQILSWPMLKEASKIFLRKGMSTVPVIVNKAQMRPTDMGGLRDGSIIYPVSETVPKTKITLDNMARESAATPPYLDRWETDKGASQKLSLLLEDMTATGAKVLVVSPPFYPLYVELVNQKTGYSNVFSQAEEILRKSFEKKPNVGYCDARKLDTLKCQGTEMMDVHHMLKPCVQKLLKYCLTEGDWSHLLSEGLH